MNKENHSEKPIKKTDNTPEGNSDKKVDQGDHVVKKTEDEVYHKDPAKAKSSEPAKTREKSEQTNK